MTYFEKKKLFWGGGGICCATQLFHSPTKRFFAHGAFFRKGPRGRQAWYNTLTKRLEREDLVLSRVKNNQTGPYVSIQVYRKPEFLVLSNVKKVYINVL